MAGLAHDHSVAACLFGETINLAEAETGALADVLGGEEGFERDAGRGCIHAEAGIGHGNADIGAGIDLVAAVFGAGHGGVFGRDRQAAATGHGITRIDGQVEQRRLELMRVDAGRVDGQIQIQNEFDMGADRLAEQGRERLDHAVYVDDLAAHHLLAGEAEQA